MSHVGGSQARVGLPGLPSSPKGLKVRFMAALRKQVRGLAALRDFDAAFVRSGSIADVGDTPGLRPLSLQQRTSANVTRHVS